MININQSKSSVSVIENAHNRIYSQNPSFFPIVDGQLRSLCRRKSSLPNLVDYRDQLLEATATIKSQR